MHQHLTPTIKGSRPQNLPNRQSDEVAKLSKRYLQVRNHAIDLKSQAAELELAVRRGQLISKDLVVKQASFLMIALRQRLLNLPVHAHKLDVDQMRKALREIAISTLKELKDLPQAVTDSNWLKTLEQDDRARS
jgi:hypothetical protein